jgi:hypothetical protein
MDLQKIAELLGQDSENLLKFKTPKVKKTSFISPARTGSTGFSHRQTDRIRC